MDKAFFRVIRGKDHGRPELPLIEGILLLLIVPIQSDMEMARDVLIDADVIVAISLAANRVRRGSFQRGVDSVRRVVEFRHIFGIDELEGGGVKKRP